MKSLIKKYYLKLTQFVLRNKGISQSDRMNDYSDTDKHKFTFELSKNAGVTVSQIKTFLMLNPWCCLGQFPSVILSSEKNMVTVVFSAIRDKGNLVEKELEERFGVNAKSDQ